MTPEGEEPASSGAYALACCAALLSLGLLALDVADLGRVTRLARDRRLEPHAGDEDAAARIDLGLGDESVAQMARGAAYRSVARPVEIVQGSFPHALRALRLAVIRDLAVAVVAGAAVFMHAGERTDAARRAHIARRAGHGVPGACVAQARWLEANEGPASRARVADLYGNACLGGIRSACDEAATRYEAEGAFERAAKMRSHQCDMGAREACHSAGVLFVRAGVELTLAFDRFLKACRGGVAEACCEGAYLAHHGEGARYEAMNGPERSWHIANGVDARDPAADARHARDLYRRAVAAGHGEDARCVALRSEGFVAP